jgi:adenosine deaminase
MLFLPIVQGDLTCIEALANKFVALQASQNVVYTEVRYSPHMLTAAAAFGALEAGGVGAALDDDAARALVDAVTRGLRSGCKAHPGVEIAQILCFIDGKPEWADSLVAIAGEHGAAGARGLAASPSEAMTTCPVVAVDVAAGEGHFAAGAAPNGAGHRAAMCRCAKLGLGLTNHAGEAGPAANVSAAASSAYGGARRIGHGYAAIREAQAALAAGGSSECVEGGAGGAESASGATSLLGALRGLGLPDGLTFELCPTSSKATGAWAGSDWARHPVALLSRLRAASEAAGDMDGSRHLPRVTISSDDPSVFDSSLTDELILAVDAMGLGEGDLMMAMRNAAEAAFLPPPAKTRLLARLARAWESWSEGA